MEIITAGARQAVCAELCPPLSEDVKEWGWQCREEGDDALGSGSDFLCVLNWFVSLLRF